MQNNNPKLRLLPVNSPILLNNKTGPYCGKIIESSELTKEHVIGRKFVPRGNRLPMHEHDPESTSRYA